MISKNFKSVPRSEPHVHDVGLCQSMFIHTESSGKAPNTRPKQYRREVVGTTEIGIEWSPLVRHAGTIATATLQRIFEPLKVPVRDQFSNPAFFKHVIGIPHGWTNVLCLSSSQQYFAKVLLSGLIAGGTNRKEGRQSCYFSTAHPQQNKAVPDQKSWRPHLTLHVHHK